MSKGGKKRRLAAALALCSLLTLWGPVAMGSSAGVEVSSEKGGVQTAQDGGPEKLSPFPYGERVKVNDLIYYSFEDIVAPEKGKALRQAGMDAKADAPLNMLTGSNWYSTASLSHLLERLLYVPPYIEDQEEIYYDEAPGDYYGETVEESTTEDYVEEADYDYGVMDGMAGVTTEAPRYSTTNVQVAEVDEADIVKTDGKYIYYLSNKGIAIVEANGGKPRQVASLKPNAQVGQNLPSYQDLYISGDTLIILAQKSGVNIFQGIDADQDNLPNSLYNTGYNSFVSIDFYDVSNPAKPRLKRQVNIQGTLNSTRFYSGSLYYVVDGSFSQQDALVNVLPKYQDSLLGPEYYVTLPEDIYLDAYGSSRYFSAVSVGAISLTEEQPIRPVVYEMNDALTLYMNQGSMYFALERYLYPAKDSDRYTAPTLAAKGLKPAYPVRRSSELEAAAKESLLLRFSLGKNSVSFQAANRIGGRVMNQRRMDVYNGVLRVVSTGVEGSLGSSYDQDYFNCILTLDAKTLKSLGSSAYFAQGQEISSARFMGDVAYLTSSSAMLVYDMSDKTRPVQQGSVSVFTNAGYLHSLGPGRLLGIGTATEKTYVKTQDNKDKQFGYRQGGVEFTLFDVSDPKRPAILDSLVVGSNGSATLAASQPKSLMFDEVKGVMTMPFSYNDFWIEDGEEVSDNWKGGLALEIGRDKLTIGATFSLGKYYASSDSRFVYIDNVLYYVSAPYLVALDYDKYEILNSLALAY